MISSSYLRLSLIILGWLVGCNSTSAATPDQQQPVTLAVVWDSRHGEFLAGAILAAEEINAAGGVGGHALQLQYLDEKPYMEQIQVMRAEAEGRYRNGQQITGMTIAKTILAHPEILAVIGHANAEITLASLITYQKNNIIFLGAQSDANLMWVTENKYFQLLPPDELLAKNVTQRLKAKNWDQVYFVFEGNRRYEQIAALIKTEFSLQGLTATGEIAILPHMLTAAYAAKRMTDIAEQLRIKRTNAILIIAGPHMAAEIIKGARTFGLLLPFVGVGDLDNHDFVSQVGEDGINTRIITLRNSGYQYDGFAQKFSKRFPDKKVDVFAAQGYDSVSLYADAVAIGESDNPFRVGHVLSVKLPIWYGVLGSYAFKNRVNTGLDYHILRLARDKDGPMHFVPDDE